MKLMTKEIQTQLPAIGAQDGRGDDAIVYCKFFNPCGSGTWYVLEFDGRDELFCFVDLHEQELGSVSLAELQNLRLRFDLGIERDINWEPTRLGDVKKQIRR